jgi:uncharacterized protein YbcV (DUF1398 family)
MKTEFIEPTEECAQGSLTGRLTFPEILQKLSRIGIERYHADFSRQEITYYLPDGTSHVVSAPHPPHPTGQEFLAASVATAVQQSQRNEHTYSDFVCKTMEAGCVGYFVQITGHRVIYFGRNGDSHTEHFPAPVSVKH